MFDQHQNGIRNGFQHGDDGFHIFRRCARCGNMLWTQSNIPIFADQLVIHQQSQLFQCSQSNNLSGSASS